MPAFLHRLSVILVLFSTLLVSGCWWRRPKPWNPTPPLPAPDTGEFNVLWDQGDPNGFPQNPYWAAQATPYPMLLPPLKGDKYDAKCVQQPNLTASEVTPGKEACTSQPTTLDQPDFFPNVLCFLYPGSELHGHVDWIVASVTGHVSWLNLADDFDYNFRFLPAPQPSPPQQDRGITANNNYDVGANPSRYIELEFASSEVADQFQTPWWQRFAQQVDSMNWDGLPQYLHPTNANQDPFAVVVGLFGLDCEHDCRSEFHPVYALAIQLDETPSQNIWEIFVRNWGNEGFCSSLNHELNLPDQKLKLVLPWPGATGLKAQVEQVYPAGSVPAISLLQDESGKGAGALLTFTLPPPSARGVIEARLNLQWTGGTAPQPHAVIESPLRAMRMTRAKEGEQDAERQLGDLRAKLGMTSGRPRLREQPQVQPPSAGVAAPVAVKVSKVRVKRPSAPAAAFAAGTKPVPDQVKAKNDRETWKQVCARLKANPQPGLDPKIQAVCAILQ